MVYLQEFYEYLPVTLSLNWLDFFFLYYFCLTDNPPRYHANENIIG